MDWQMKLLKYIKVSFLFLILCTPAHAISHYSRCKYQYDTNNMVICSERVLLPSEQTGISSKYNKVTNLYPLFIKDHGYVLKSISVKLTVYLMPFETLNDTQIFPRPNDQILLGRYSDWSGKLYTSYNAISVGNTDLIHELAHYFNNNVPILNDDENEKIALQFEQYYLDNS